MTAADLQPGDVLLYKPASIYGQVIAVKTWHRISHVETFVGKGYSVASRDGQGTGKYPLRTSQLAVVCRPREPYDLAKAIAWFDAQPHRPYGWTELLNFVGIDIDGKGIVCSPFATEFVRAGGLDPFNGEPANAIAPFQFELADCFVRLAYADPAPAAAAA